jgi:hypothetical protein
LSTAALYAYRAVRAWHDEYRIRTAVYHGRMSAPMPAWVIYVA